MTAYPDPERSLADRRLRGHSASGLAVIMRLHATLDRPSDAEQKSAAMDRYRDCRD
ncbi:hypothetical protein [Halocatena marina]|uniref:hypothetical protein n=1 Tax=Halocatena marina TaxID=2934937 RepID=UPI00200ECEAA|nr:hypothetical protein [Halocatena marina]